MELLGERAWWLPRWLGRILPRINIEGEGWFAEHEGAAKSTM
jgi:putative drug exporter of the RND superfamily